MRKLLIALLSTFCWFALVTFVSSSSAFVVNDDGKISEKNYGQILIDMQKKEVIKLLGEPRDLSNACPEFPATPFFPAIVRALVWQNNQIRIMIVFDRNNRVSWKKLDRAILGKKI